MEFLAIILIHNFASAGVAVVHRSLAVKLPHAFLQINAVGLVTILLSGLIWVVLFGGPVSLDFIRWLPWLIGGGIAFALVNALAFKAFSYVDAAIGSLLGTFSIVVTVIGSTFLIHEGLTLHAAIGTAMIIAASWIALSARVGKRVRKTWNIGLWLSLASACVFALATINEKFLINNMGLSSYIVWGWSIQAILAVVLSLVISRRGWKDLRKAKPYGLLGMSGILRSASGLSFVTALVVINNLSVVAALSGLKVILAAFFGLLFLHEGRFMLRKLNASALAAVGVAVMFW